MQLEQATIDRYGPLRACDPPCDDGISIIAGPNESGKTLYLEGILQLLDPNVTEHFSPGPRIKTEPAGRVIVDTGTEHITVSNDRPLSSFSPIETRHLATLFVIRDSDLALPHGPDYYTKLVEQLGNIHTSEIGSLRFALVEEGRLTKERLNLADREYDTRSVHQEATVLANEIDRYLDRIDENDVGQAVRRRIQQATTLRNVEIELERQKSAKEQQRYEDAVAQLDQFRTASDRIAELQPFDRQSLEILRENDRTVSQLDNRIRDLEATVEDQREHIEQLRSDHSTAAANRHRLELRTDAVETVEAKLGTYREQRDTVEQEGGEALDIWSRRIAVGSAIGGGAGVGGGAAAGGVIGMVAVGIGIALLAVMILVTVRRHRRHRRHRTVSQLQRELLDAATDAGFDAESPDTVARAVQSYHNEREVVRERERTLEARLETSKERLSEIRDSLADMRERRDAAQQEIDTVFDDVPVSSMEGFADRVTEREEIESERENATSALTRLLSEPPDTGPSAAIDHWESVIGAWDKQLDGTHEKSPMFDQDELDRLERERDRLREELEDLEATIDDFETQLSEFDRRATDITVPPFVETDPTLDARTVAGLGDLRDQLRTVIETIEQNADRSRKAIELLDDINREEEEKISTLFDPSGQAAKMLAQLTDGRYRAVIYDRERRTLAVEREDGMTFTPESLSRATRDQLYFAARLSLAEQLLGGDPGFLLLDDPFLAADRDRLQNGFGTLSTLAEAGWQIIYLTAKQEVWNDVGPAFDCPVEHLAQLEY